MRDNLSKFDRYAFTVISSILVYGVAWAMLGMPGSASSTDSDDGNLSPADAPLFKVNCVYHFHDICNFYRKRKVLCFS